MSLYLVFAFGFVAGNVLAPRAPPLAAICLGCVLLIAGHQLGVFTP